MVFYGFMALIIILLPAFVRSIYIMHLINTTLIYAIIISGMNIIMGYCGQFMLTQAAFFGVGAYTSAILSTQLGLSFWICLPSAIVVTSIAGFLTSLPCLRVRGHYLAVVSLGIAIIIHEAMMSLVDLTKGPGGIFGIPPPFIFGMALNNDHKYYYLLLVFSTLSILFVKFVLMSRVGRAIIAIRESYTAAEATGINYRFYKIIAITLSASYGGLAGSLYAHLVKFISPDSFGIEELLLEIAMLVVGGIGTLAGPVFGSIAFNFGFEYLRAFKGLQMVIYGLMILLFVIFMPQGLITIKDKVLALRKRFTREYANPF
jgi:branched-chain amino acid transport system permease protein